MALRKTLYSDASGYYAEMDPTADSAAFGALTLNGNITMSGNKVTGLGAATTAGDAASYGQSGLSLAGLALTAALAMGGQLINNVADPVSAQDAATKNYVDLKLQGLTWKAPVLLVSTTNVALTGEQTIDGVLTSGSRVLLTGQTTASQNGFYVTAAGAWARTTDMAAGSHAADNAVFVEEGTAGADTAWVCTTDPPNDVVGTNSLTFTQFSSAGVTTASTGLVKVGNDIRVKPGDGIDVVSNSASTNVALDATAPGLQFTGVAGSGKLQVKVLSTGGIQVLASGVSILLPASSGLQTAAGGLSILNDPNGGLTASAAGEAVKPDATTGGNPTVAIGANGLRVIGLPSLFNINSVATSANVTAANLGTLTAGPTSDATALHTHTNDTYTSVTVSALAAGDPVYQSSTNNQVDKGDAATDAKSLIIAVNSSGAVGAAGTATLIRGGKNAGVLTGATAGTAYYLGSGGGLTVTVPTGSKRTIGVGYAINATDLFVMIRDLGKKA